MSLQQQHQIVVSVDGNSLGVFDTRSGGEINGVVAKRRSGGMGPIKQSAGLPDYGDVTVSRSFEKERDQGLFRHLATRAGKAEMVINDFILDENGQRFNTKPITYVGKLLTITGSDADSESTDYGMLTLVMSVRSVA